MKLTRKSLEKSLELAEKATPGPWTPFDSGPWGGKGAGIAIGEDVEMWPKFDNDTSKGVANSFFVAFHNPEFITALVQAHIEALKLAEQFNDFIVQCKDQGKTLPGEVDSLDDNVFKFLAKHGGAE